MDRGEPPRRNPLPLPLRAYPCGARRRLRPRRFSRPRRRRPRPLRRPPRPLRPLLRPRRPRGPAADAGSDPDARGDCRSRFDSDASAHADARRPPRLPAPAPRRPSPPPHTAPWWLRPRPWSRGAHRALPPSLAVRRPGRALLDLRGTGLRPDLRARVLPLRDVPRGITVARQKWVSASLRVGASPSSTRASRLGSTPSPSKTRPAARRSRCSSPSRKSTPPIHSHPTAGAQRLPPPTHRRPTGSPQPRGHPEQTPSGHATRDPQSRADPSGPGRRMSLGVTEKRRIPSAWLEAALPPPEGALLSLVAPGPPTCLLAGERDRHRGFLVLAWGLMTGQARLLQHCSQLAAFVRPPPAELPRVETANPWPWPTWVASGSS